MFIVLFYLTKKLRFCFLSDLKSLRLRAIKSFTDLCTIFLPSLSEKNKSCWACGIWNSKGIWNFSLQFISKSQTYTRAFTHTHIYIYIHTYIYDITLSNFTSHNNFLLDWFLKNPSIKLYVHYVHTKFHVNQMSFTIWSRSSYFMHNFKCKNLRFKYMIDNIVIDLRSSWNFSSM